MLYYFVIYQFVWYECRDSHVQIVVKRMRSIVALYLNTLILVRNNRSNMFGDKRYLSRSPSVSRGSRVIRHGTEQSGQMLVLSVLSSNSSRATAMLWLS